MLGKRTIYLHVLLDSHMYIDFMHFSFQLMKDVKINEEVIGVRGFHFFKQIDDRFDSGALQQQVFTHNIGAPLLK